MQENLQQSERMVLDPEERKLIDVKFNQVFGNQY